MSAIDAISSSALDGSGLRTAELARSQQDFASILSRAKGDPGASREQRARESAESLVAITMVQPVLTKLRESNMAAEPFKPTPAEKQFRALQDARLAQDLVRKMDLPLVERVARGVLKRVGAAAHAEGQGGPHARKDTPTP